MFYWSAITTILEYIWQIVSLLPKSKKNNFIASFIISLVGHILGLGDRHLQNILIDKQTAELVHIDLGIAFEQGRLLPTPETVPFR